MKYPNSATRKMYSKNKTIHHERVIEHLIHQDGALKGAAHFKVIQAPYIQTIKPKCL